MDYAGASHWLPTTVQGLLILGTIASLLASALIWLCRRMLFRWLPFAVLGTKDSLRHIRSSTASLLLERDLTVVLWVAGAVMLTVVSSMSTTFGVIAMNSAIMVEHLQHGIPWQSQFFFGVIVTGTGFIYLIGSFVLYAAMLDGALDYLKVKSKQANQE